MKSLSNVGAERLGDALGESIDDGAKLSIISSYFTVFAYGELKEELSKVDEVRFLFSEPTFIKRMADSKEPREFEVARRAREVGVGGSGLELTLRNNLNQRALARECAEWIREKGVFKSAKTSGAIQPGGTYVVENPSGDDHAFMGAAANFTQEGLGYERRPGTVTCVSHFENATEAVGLKMMFESVWDNPAMVEEVTAQVAAQVETLYRENPPEFIYFLTLYHLFRDFMEDDEDNGIRPGLKFEESVVWSKLYDFQKDAVVGAIRKLEKYKGCIIADSVGLGKTYEALAVMKYYQERNDRIERVDACLVALLSPLLPASPAPHINTESLGMAIDRLSILSLKIWHMDEQVRRTDVTPEHIASCEKKLAVLKEQRADLSLAVKHLVTEFVEGTKTPKLYFQFKMYNDPTLNPELYGK